LARIRVACLRISFSIFSGDGVVVVDAVGTIAIVE